ncbi:unnamed protein product [Heligmosomoides polygyrus]|uniref:Translocation protein SEC62 n=1 Tax=Heligmosomoides polygyrus TaxID=6339 RepID=A0A3P8D8L8_HELPZ|nr:unnamed protein product [Heligmosomoides polygyrus]
MKKGIRIYPSRRRQEKFQEAAEQETLSKEQDSIARYVRFNCPTSATMFQGNEVHYFTGGQLAVVPFLWLNYFLPIKVLCFRQAAVNYMRELLSHQLFFRARKLVPKKKDDKEKKDKGEYNMRNYFISKVFNDDKDVYVWVFDPTPLYKKIIGLLLGTIVGCLFPLWPMWLRQGVYYLSLGGIALFGAIVVVAILRTILFGIIWLATMGQHKLWILPNLTEDCGFFESFQPWYTYEYCPREKKDKDGKRKKTKKAKDSVAPSRQFLPKRDPLKIRQTQ